ncbi:hypothetical protein HYS49_01135 [Candidatus Woesearchaeota archaeon]|nr:hypothetical protein [Candidatus Woesearchaeota archaeon]
MTIFQLLAILGFFLSAYAFYVQRRAKKKKSYQPLCDLAKNISCTKAFLSKEGKIAVLPNMVYGIFYYALLFVLSFFVDGILLFLTLPAVGASLFLAYVSYLKQRNFCLVCTTIYLINVLLAVSSWP